MEVMETEEIAKEMGRNSFIRYIFWKENQQELVIHCVWVAVGRAE